MDTIIIGIDPGKNGGIAKATFRDGSIFWPSFQAMSMTGDVGVIYNFLSSCVDSRVNAIIGIEQLGGFIAGASAPTLFKLGVEYGKVKTIAELLASMSSRVKVDMIPPKTWQQEMTSLKRRDFPSESKWKDHLKSKARLWLSDNNITKIIPTLKTADAILILRYLLEKNLQCS